jgi:hypothetical protein
VTISPDNRYFADVHQTHDEPPATQIVDGGVVATLAKAITRFSRSAFKVEMFPQSG